MCRRFWIPALQPDIEALFRQYFGLDLTFEDHHFDRECLPFTEIPGVVFQDGAFRLIQMYWNLIPSGSPEFKPGKTWFNARAEKLSEPYQESLLKKKRCVFVASRFSEKRYEFRLRNDDVMFLGGLYDIWNEEKFSCTVITVPANETVLRAHDRMPYLVQRDHLARWLDPGNTNAVELRSGISPYPAEGMDGWREDNQTELF